MRKLLKDEGAEVILVGSLSVFLATLLGVSALGGLAILTVLFCGGLAILTELFGGGLAILTVLYLRLHGMLPNIFQ